jgi:hypothetical protein
MRTKFQTRRLAHSPQYRRSKPTTSSSNNNSSISEILSDLREAFLA